jgi:hypothetical protein
VRDKGNNVTEKLPANNHERCKVHSANTNEGHNAQHPNVYFTDLPVQIYFREASCTIADPLRYKNYYRCITLNIFHTKVFRKKFADLTGCVFCSVYEHLFDYPFLRKWINFDFSCLN